ncbi:MAG: biotin--[acetyl-CoA-carboxylase] ligase [Flavobacteriaceae bacterium]|nr:biotin--[acetyl-CoA-carboxylase] ligase [Flavobacteriaceae bacterium]
MHIIKLHTTDSTNSALNEALQKKHLIDGTVLWTEHQRQGRGQAGRSWHSELDKSLTFSILKRFESLKLEHLTFLNMQIACSLGMFLQHYSTQKIQWKWPNDILSNEKKITGILIENSIQSRFVKHSIIGIGINLFPIDYSKLPKATSLFNDEAKAFDRKAFLEELVHALLTDLNQFEQGDFRRIKENYLQQLYGFNRLEKYRITATNEIIDARIIDIDEHGRLVVVSKSGKDYAFENRAVELIY